MRPASCTGEEHLPEKADVFSLQLQPGPFPPANAQGACSSLEALGQREIPAWSPGSMQTAEDMASLAHRPGHSSGCPLGPQPVRWGHPPAHLCPPKGARLVVTPALVLNRK